MDRDNIIRKLKYEARRRSTLELDVLLGTLVQRLPWNELTGRDLEDLTGLLALDEVLLQKALLSRGPAPEGVPSAFWDRILALMD